VIQRLVLIFLIVLLGAAIWRQLRTPATSDLPAHDIDSEITALTQPWELSVPAQEVPDGLSTLTAAECGECHTAIYREWQTTAHANAYLDLQFQAEWKKDNELWLCLNCHTPLENQREQIVTGLRGGDFRSPITQVNDRFDPALRDEGITCAACHVRDGFVLAAVANSDAPHPVKSGVDLLTQLQCEGCHNVQAELSPTLICTFATGDEWRKSGQPEEGKGCIDCHMPAVSRPLVEAGPTRSGHLHTWMGAGIAKFPAQVQSVLTDYRSGYDIEATAYRLNESAEVQIDAAITNARAGHELPTGDPERFITLEFVLRDRGGTSLWNHTERIGELWEWYPQARQLGDNSLRPDERRDFHYVVPLAPGVNDAITLEVIAQNHRMTDENARAMAIYGRYPLQVETYRRSVTVDEGGNNNPR
jgi:Cytochrome c554 and c-prime